MSVRSGRSITTWVVPFIVLTLLTLPSVLLADTVPLTTANAMARVAKKVSPDYPPAARQLNISGTQEVEITVNEQGDVVAAKVLKGNAMFSVSSTNAIKQWKFTPLQVDGAAKSFTTVIVFNYTK